MKIVIAGRPNTGKSTLFNGLTGTRDALVHDRPGVTRDCVSGIVVNRDYEITDTAGLENAKTGIAHDSTDMAIAAIANADAVLFVVDGRVGITAEDLTWARTVHRKTKAPVLLLVNKAESSARLADINDFYKLGFGEPVLVSAEHKRGFDLIYEFIDKIANEKDEKKPANTGVSERIKIAVSAPPVDGKANEALIKWLSKHLHIAKSAITLVSGATDRSKTLLIAGDTAELIKKLEL